MILYCYPRWGTCKKAVAFLEANNIDFEYVDIKEAPPSAKLLKKYYDQSGLPIKKFFNTSGMAYRALNMKEKFAVEDDDQLLARLAADGMLIKRPLLVSDDVVLVGFKEADWQANLKL